MPEQSATLHTLMLLHRLLGYPVVFVLAPIALASFAGRGPHRRVGLAFAVGMLTLYLSGSVFTFTQYEYRSWEFGRNAAFNLAGILFAASGARAAWLWARPAAPRPTALDHSLFAALAACVALMTALAVVKSTSLRVFAILSITLLVLDRRDWRAGFTRATLFARHARYILASYFYALTVASVVHLRDEMSGNTRWLWPSALGLFTIWVVQGAATPGHASRARAQRVVVAGVVALSLAFGVYAVYELRRDGLATPPNPRREAGPRA